MVVNGGQWLAKCQFQKYDLQGRNTYECTHLGNKNPLPFLGRPNLPAMPCPGSNPPGDTPFPPSHAGDGARWMAAAVFVMQIVYKFLTPAARHGERWKPRRAIGKCGLTVQVVVDGCEDLTLAMAIVFDLIEMLQVESQDWPVNYSDHIM